MKVVLRECCGVNHFVVGVCMCVCVKAGSWAAPGIVSALQYSVYLCVSACVCERTREEESE